ncbi:LOW QUALITY PROTEIN: sialidase-4-like [Thalassophryne amazonica]|uniref:LOW QUALITY PROTEIN: sialidase-4-like n=1 Tax=Thalassophryne amazonica TaxID=390379 RepID=UPI0014712B01|nr:LOW QUALITY PROTEIN: sialidase-4-like [Thalassophryne amazonica]
MAPRDLPGLFKSAILLLYNFDSSFPAEWATFALGPGHGIQLKSGRLLIPAYAYHIECKECFGQLCQTTPHSFCFHSDTHGRTWSFGQAVPGPESVECQMVSVDEEGDNLLYCNARSPLGYRVQAVSLDDGAVFQEGQLVQRLVEPQNGCHGSIVGFPAPLHLHHSFNYYLSKPIHCSKHWAPCAANSHHISVDKTSSLKATVSPRISSSHSNSDSSILNVTERPIMMTILSSPQPIAPPDFLTPTWVVYSHPTWTSVRKDLGVFLNLFPRDPDSWHGPWVIYKGPSAYSDLAYLELSASPGSPPAVAFACLFECGTKTPYDEICFSIFTLYELIDNLPRDVQSGLDSTVNQRHHSKRQTLQVTEAGCCSSNRCDTQNLNCLYDMIHGNKKDNKLSPLCSLS